MTFLRSQAFKILIFVVGSIVIGALLAPPLFWGGKKVVAEGWIEGGALHSLHDSMDRAQFSRYFNRAQLAGALLMLWPTLSWMRRGRGGEGQSEKGNRFGLEKNRRWLSHLLIGFFAAAVPLFLLGAAYLHLGWYAGHETLSKSLTSIIFASLGTAFAVSFLEEFVFRGALHAVMKPVLRPWPLFLSVAFFFALVHFLTPPHGLAMPEVKATTGFWMLGQIFGQFRNPYFLAAEFAVLFAIGWVLGFARMKTASLWLGIGLHAGWVFGVKVLGSTSYRNFEASEMMPWLGDSLRVGAVSCAVVCLTGLGLWCWLRRSVSRKAFLE